MHLRYDKQLDFKQDLLQQALKKFKPAGYENYTIHPTIGMDQPSHYRAKLQFQTRSFKGQVKAGLYAENSHRLIGITDCYVQDQETQKIINSIADLLTKHRVPIYNERKEQGIRSVMVRRARQSGQVQVIFVTSCQVNLTKLIGELIHQFPTIVTVALNWNRQKTSDIYGEKTEILWGKQAIEEAVLDYEFSYHLGHFTN